MLPCVAYMSSVGKTYATMRSVYVLCGQDISLMYKYMADQHRDGSVPSTVTSCGLFGFGC